MGGKTMGACKPSVVDWVCFILVVIGALNWGLVGLFDFNLVNAIFGSLALLERLVYIVVGLAGLYLIYACITCCKKYKACCSREGNGGPKGGTQG